MKTTLKILPVLCLIVFQASAAEYTVEDNEDEIETLVTQESLYQKLSVNGCPAINQFGKDHFANGSGELANCPDSKNVTLGFNRIFRGGAPNQPGVDCLRSLGITAIFDLRTEANVVEKGHEPDWSKNAGIQYFSFPMEAASSAAASLACVEAKLSSAQCNQKSVLAFIETAKQYLQQNPLAKIYVHCARGQDRTGLALGIYRIMEQKCSPSAARAEMEEYRFSPFPPLETVWKNLTEKIINK